MHIPINSDLVVNESAFQFLTELDCFFFQHELKLIANIKLAFFFNESHGDKYKVILGKLKKLWHCIGLT